MGKHYFFLLAFFWCSILFLLVFFSFTQIDLNLTFLNWQPYLQLQDQLIYLGYFNRGGNSLFFTLLLICLAIFYLLIIHLSIKKKINFLQFKILIFCTITILFFSYNAFSRDFFNYMFDARIITKYGLNPYFYRPLDFPQDDWIRFMHSTHVNSRYGPFWILITVIPSAIGLGKFLITYFLFKLIFAVSYLMSLVFIFKIAKELGDSKDNLIPLSLFAFHPLILINGLVSPHLDLVMAALALGSVYFYLIGSREKRWTLILVSYVYLITSIGVKFATLTLVPLLNKYVFSFLKKGQWLFCLFLVSLLMALLQVFYSHGLQTWYLLIPTAFLPILYLATSLRLTLIVSLLFQLSLINYIFFVLSGKF